MIKDRKKPEIEDEPGAEERFKRGIERALETPPKPHKEMKKGKATDKRKGPSDEQG